MHFSLIPVSNNPLNLSIPYCMEHFGQRKQKYNPEMDLILYHFYTVLFILAQLSDFCNFLIESANKINKFFFPLRNRMFLLEFEHF
jgi:hypothetical protein